MVYVFTVQSFPLNPDKSSTPLTFVDSIRVLYRDGPLLLRSPKLYLRPTNMEVVSYGQIHQVDNLVVCIYMSLPCSACFGFTILASGVLPWLRKPPHDLPWNGILPWCFRPDISVPPWPLPAMVRTAWFLAFASAGRGNMQWCTLEIKGKYTKKNPFH